MPSPTGSGRPGCSALSRRLPRSPSRSARTSRSSTSAPESSIRGSHRCSTSALARRTSCGFASRTCRSAPPARARSWRVPFQVGGGQVPPLRASPRHPRRPAGPLGLGPCLLGGFAVRPIRRLQPFRLDTPAPEASPNEAAPPPAMAPPPAPSPGPCPQGPRWSRGLSTRACRFRRSKRPMSRPRGASLSRPHRVPLRASRPCRRAHRAMRKQRHRRRAERCSSRFWGSEPSPASAATPDGSSPRPGPRRPRPLHWCYPPSPRRPPPSPPALRARRMTRRRASLRLRTPGDPKRAEIQGRIDRLIGRH